MSKDFMYRLSSGGTHRKKESTSKAGLQKGLTRATYIVPQEYADKIRAIAYWESYRQTVEEKKMVRVTVTDVASEALGDYVKKYERKHGKIEPIPED